MIPQLATSSENLVASTQFLVALATSESQFQALLAQRCRSLLIFQLYFLAHLFAPTHLSLWQGWNGKYSTDCCSVTIARWWILVGLPCLPLVECGHARPS